MLNLGLDCDFKHMSVSVVACPRTQRYQHARAQKAGRVLFCSPFNGLPLKPGQDRAQFPMERGVDLAPVPARSPSACLSCAPSLEYPSGERRGAGVRALMA